MLESGTLKAVNPCTCTSTGVATHSAPRVTVATAAYPNAAASRSAVLRELPIRFLQQIEACSRCRLNV